MGGPGSSRYKTGRSVAAVSKSMSQVWNHQYYSAMVYNAVNLACVCVCVYKEGFE